jgi:hypothetical protein
MNQKQIYKTVSDFLKNRKYVFTRINKDLQKQQIIFKAENYLNYLAVPDHNSFKNNCKRFANDFIAPLIPSENSKLYNHAKDLYNQLINQ